MRKIEIFHCNRKTLLNAQLLFRKSDSIFGLQHNNTVSSDDNHSDLVLLSLLRELDGIVQHKIHKRIKSAQSSLNISAAVDSQVDSLVHEFLQLWRMGLGHLGGFLFAFPC